MKKAPVQTANESPAKNDCITSQRARRALTHLWIAARAIDGADLTDDDVLLIHEALTEIAEGVHHG